MGVIAIIIPVLQDSHRIDVHYQIDTFRYMGRGVTTNCLLKKFAQCVNVGISQKEMPSVLSHNLRQWGGNRTEDVNIRKPLCPELIQVFEDRVG